jgi:PhnB protein
MSTSKRPDGHHTITPGFICDRAGEVIAFVKKAFGGEVVDSYEGPGGAIMHAEVKIGDSVVMLGEPMPELPAMPASLSLYVDSAGDVDATYRRAVDAGATPVSEPKDQFYGWRAACVRDVGGNRWNIATVVEELSRDEIVKRMESMGQ